MNTNDAELAAYIRNEMRNDRSFLVEALNKKKAGRRHGLLRMFGFRIKRARSTTKACC